MSFSDNIIKSLGLQSVKIKYKVSLIDGNYCYIEGVLKVLKVQNNLITLQVKNGEIAVTGENLKLTCCCFGDVSIIGDIKMVEKLK